MEIKGKRTLIIAFIGALVPVLQSAEIVSLIPDGYELAYALLLSVVMAYMRYLTDTAILQAK